MTTPEPESLYNRIRQRYLEHNVPWDHTLPPPEVLAFAEAHHPGRLLDLGCGYGRACLHLANHGWQCDGVDFVSEAIQGAQTRAAAAGLAGRVQFHHADITALDFLTEPYDLVLDVGCLHAQPQEVCQRYAEHVRRLTRPGGTFLLFAHLREDSDPESRRWITRPALEALFSRDFGFDRIELGTTTVGEDTWPSAWFWLRRLVSD
ncbi:MAG: class I SAM-dependent methyltransferase [Anaerolineales bacterium]|nr:class I SAM-dependent methyltransferase [Anaerolineales bacterium]